MQLPVVNFVGDSYLFSNSTMLKLTNIADIIKANPSCNVKVRGFGTENKRYQQLSWSRVNAVIKHLVEEEGISESRLIFIYGQSGESNNRVILEFTNEEGPNTAPAPHPELRRKVEGRH